MNRARILLADDHAAFLQTATALLEPGFDILGSVGNGQDLLAEAKRLQPDIVILDIAMPVINGIQAAIQLHDSGCQAKMIFLTGNDRPELVRACSDAGASGYVLKRTTVTDLPVALREVLKNHQFVSPCVGVG
jgi:DNA-binding NarL/FixJ family response regulator